MPYQQPPEHSRFRKGVSGNPSGRPKKRTTFFDDLLDELQRPSPDEGCSNQRAIAKRLVSAALNGHFASASLIVSLVARFESADRELSTDQRSAAEADILDHVIDPPTAEGDRPAVPEA